MTAQLAGGRGSAWQHGASLIRQHLHILSCSASASAVPVPVPVQSALSTLPLIRPLFSLNLQHCIALHCGQCTLYPPSPFKWTPSIQHLHPGFTASLCSRCQLLCLPFKGPPLATLCPGYPVARSVTRPMCGDPVISGHMLGGDTVLPGEGEVAPARGVQLRTLPATCSDPGPPLEQGCVGRGLWLAPGGRWSQLLSSSRILR